METKDKILAFILVVAAAGLGYGIYAKKLGFFGAPPSAERDAAQAPTPKEQQQSLLQHTFEGSTPEQIANRDHTAKAVATETDTIWVGRCLLDPGIAKVRSSSTLHIKNQGGTQVVVSFPRKTYTLPRDASTSILVNSIGKTGWTYGYRCESKEGYNDSYGLILIGQ